MRPVRRFTIFSSPFFMLVFVFVWMLAIRHGLHTSSTTKSAILSCARFDPFICGVLLQKKYKRTVCSLVWSCALPLKGTSWLRSSPSSNAFSHESLSTADGFRSNAFLPVNLVNGRIIEQLQESLNTTNMLLSYQLTYT